MKFEITKEQQEKINKWLKEEVEPELLINQKEQYKNSPFIMSLLERGEVYTGPIGGSLTYSFSNTSVGQIIYVKHFSGQELNLTNYSDW